MTPPSGSRGGNAPPKHLAPGDRVGRYIIESEVGAGGMGVVYAAHDPELERRIAIKLLRAEQAGEEPRARLLREAQALARLKHPNVITVHDVGTLGDRVFIAMDFVEGQTLDRWRRVCERTWQEVLEVLRKAGAGLAAAHRAGLVHRDFKPDNLVIGDDGRILVVDFGLARASGALEPSLASDSSLSLPSPRLREPLTQTGSVMGTLAYMAPEQPLNRGADARSDQFSYCVTFYEALYGEHPFAAESSKELIAKILSGSIAEHPPGSQVPLWLRQILLRGLQVSPEARYPSLDDLLDDLRRVPLRRSRRRSVVAAGLLATVTLLALWGLYRERREQLCTGAEEHLAGVWDSARKRQVQMAISQVPAAYAPAVWSKVQGQLDVYTARWSEIFRQACEATRLRAERSEDLLDQQMLCLEERLAEVDALLDLLSEGAEGVKVGVQVLEELGSVEVCDDLSRVAATVPPPRSATTRDRLTELHSQLAEGQVLLHAGRYRESSEMASSLVEPARALDYPPLAAEVLLLLGTSQSLLEDPAGEESLRQALLAAEAGGHDEVAAQSAIQLSRSHTLVTQDLDEAREWDDYAAAKLARLGPRAEASMAELLDVRGIRLRVEGRYEEALDAHREAIALLGARGPSLEHARALTNFASTLGRLQRHEESVAYHLRSLEMQEQLVGADHPLVAAAANNLAIGLRRLGQLERAETYLRKALQAFRSSYGETHRNTIAALNNLGSTLQDLGRADEALDMYRQALAIVEAEPDHPDLSLTLMNYGGLELDTGHDTQALEAFERALELDRAALGEDHPFVAEGHYYVADTLGRLGRLREGIEHLERALAIRLAQETPPADLAATRFLLARFLTESGGSPVQARSLAREARRDFQRAGPSHSADLAQVDAWLAGHASGPPALEGR